MQGMPEPLHLKNLKEGVAPGRGDTVLVAGIDF
jgi:hypothetical protein